MHAEDIAEEFPAVGLDADALDAVRLLADNRLPAVIVVDESGKPYTVLPAAQVVHSLVPGYVRDDPSLAGVLTESMADQITSKLAAKTVRGLLPEEPPELPVVQHDDTLVEVAAAIAGSRFPLAVVHGCKLPIGVITASRLLERALSTS
ncbi:CBS domain-containing protein [Sciscionella marina]|uniref:CBS domain-containing protein n=1 Tax=Sciscionella marina TaxID=508770 RepID=UPI00036B4C73|nr:CBS domain-containing protein [Sciscionella marina]